MKQVLRAETETGQIKLTYDNGDIEHIPCLNDSESYVIAIANHMFRQGYNHALRVGVDTDANA